MNQTIKPQDSDTARVRLTLDVTYSLNGENATEMVSLLRKMCERASGEGMLTGESDAEVEEYSIALELISEANKPVFVVFSSAEYEADGQGFWNNDAGWTNLENAQRYDSNESPLLHGQMFVTVKDAQAIEAGNLQEFVRMSGSRSISDDDLCVTSDASTHLKFRVIGAHPNRTFFDIEVQADHGLDAFGAAALQLKEAGEGGDAEFYAAIPVGAAYELPGEGVVTLETVLDPEQADVFGLPTNVESTSVCDECGASDASMVGCPDGAEICQDCFNAGLH